MRFRLDSDEEACGERIEEPKFFERHGAFMCMRTKGHAGEHLSRMDLAANADGVCPGCRSPIGEPHKADCHAAKEARR